MICPKCDKVMHRCINGTQNSCIFFYLCPYCQIFRDMNGKTLTAEIVNSYGD